MENKDIMVAWRAFLCQEASRAYGDDMNPTSTIREKLGVG